MQRGDTVGGVSQRMLKLTLKTLERDGILSRAVIHTIPPRVDYGLTSLGETLLEPLAALVAWVDDHRSEIDAAQRRYDERSAKSVRG